jgi:hypothetical protein
MTRQVDISSSTCPPTHLLDVACGSDINEVQRCKDQLCGEEGVRPAEYVTESGPHQLFFYIMSDQFFKDLSVVMVSGWQHLFQWLCWLSAKV